YIHILAQFLPVGGLAFVPLEQHPNTGGNDIIDGGDGDDILFGQQGNDQINGGAGNDTIVGGPGNDTLLGGAGDDTFYYYATDGADVIDGGSGFNTLFLTEDGNANSTINAIVVGGILTQLNGSTIANVQHVYGQFGGPIDTLSYAGTTEAVSAGVWGLLPGFDEL